MGELEMSGGSPVRSPVPSAQSSNAYPKVLAVQRIANY